MLTTEKRKKIINALISEPTHKKACEVAGISERALYDYMKDDKFVDEYKSVINAMIDATITGLKGSMGKALEHLQTVISDTETDTETKLKADKMILDYCIKLQDVKLKDSVFDNIADFDL